MKHQLITFLTLTFIVSCGGGGGGGGSDSAPAPQNISVSLTSSADSAEVNSSITLTWSSTLATSCSASGAWSGSKGTSGSESITIGVGGSNTFSLSCSATGANSGSASTTVNGLRYFDGKVFDGYIRGAEVFVDTNNNSALDSDETSVTTDNQGNFTKLLYTDGSVISKGGIDSDTGADLSSLTLAHKMVGFEATKIISPITSLAAYMEQPEDINAALGINASIDLMSVDPIPNLGQSEYNYIYEKGNQLTVIAYSLQNSLNAINQTTETSQDYFVSIAEEIEKSYAASPGLVDIESNAFIDAVVENIIAKKASSIDATDKTNMTSAISSVIPLMQVKSDTATTTAIQNFAFRTMQTDIKSIATGDASTGTVDNYNTNILTYISTDQNISSSDLEIDISAFSDSASLDEDSSIEISPLTNDSYLRGQPVQLSIATSPINGSASLANEVITYTPDADWNGSESFTYSIVQGSKSATGTIEVTVAPINDAPVINAVSEFSVNETIQSVATISATDVDQDDLTYSLSGTDAELFAISSTGVLTFVSSPDFENPADSDANNIYELTVSVSDGTLVDEQILSVTVVNTTEETNGPVFTSLTVTPSTIDVSTDSATVTLTLSITDESGVNDSRPTPYIAQPGSPNYSASAPWSLVSGDSKNGTYEATVTIPAGTPPGEYYIWKGYWTDINGTNTQESSTGNDHSSGYGASNGGVTINSDVETNGPVFTSLTVTPSTIDVSTDSATVTLTLSITDESGVNDSRPTPYIAKPGSPNYSASAPWSLVSGDSKNGTYEATVTIPAGTPPGEYYIWKGYWTDINGTNTQESSTGNDHSSGYGASNGGVTITNVDEGGGSSETIYYLYGDSSQSTYLGCYGCGSSNAESICNESGTYGSSIGVSSIWNSVGMYGSTVGTDSPWNSVGTNPPEFFNSKDKTSSYGKFTVNAVAVNRTNTAKLTNILDFFENSSDNHSATRNYACSTSETSINVTVAANNNGSGNVYVINGEQNASLTLDRGKSYTFEHPSGHPFRFSTTSDGTHGFGIEYTDDVAKSSGSTTIAVGSNTPVTLYYYCSIHSGMGGTITIN